MSSSSSPRVVALVGAPNSGKTTLFNWLTGKSFRTVNYPGSTIDVVASETRSVYEERLTILDTPGTYSLTPKTPEEEVTRRALFADKPFQIEKVIVVVDATQLSRQLYLVEQVARTNIPFCVALTMSDLLNKEDLKIDIEKLKAKYGVAFVLIDGTLGGGSKELLAQVGKLAVTQEKVEPQEWSHSERQKVNEKINNIAHEVLSDPKAEVKARGLTESMDKFFLNPYLGLLVFASIMFALFSSIFWAAAPFMDIVDGFFGDFAGWTYTGLGEGLVADFVANGVVASMGAVLVFVPQIFILFLGISFLEDSGYLARAATLIDRPFSKLGLNGRSFVPLLSGFACAVPAMMATRTIGSKREKWITMFIIPFMTCSARLPVYALLLSFLFFGEAAWKPGLALAALYIGALVIGAIAAAMINKVLKIESHSLFMMELPLYRRPRAFDIAKSSYLRTRAYIRRAGPIIFVLAALIWAVTTFPHYDIEDSGERLAKSYAGQVGAVVEPVFQPMGVDWRVGVGLISAFAAREVFVASLAVMFSISEDLEEEQLTDSLISKMQTATLASGEPVFTLATTVGLIVFFMIALQCISTTGIAVKEMGSWKFALVQLAIMNIAAYLIAIAVVQGLRIAGIA